ncbi:MAG: hypothetical protein JJ958_12120 [Balneola sp.]|nr:hypothetical protein [Balneola sp.]
MKKHIIKIAFTIIWTILGLWISLPVDNGREIGDIWMEGGDLLVKTSEPTFDFGFFAIFMIPVAVLWIWSLFSNESKDTPVKRKSRMF